MCTRVTHEKRPYHRAVATRLVILISAHDLIAASRTDGRDRVREREREGAFPSCAQKEMEQERKRERKEGEEKDIERDAGTFYCLGPRSRAPRDLLGD